MSLRRPVFLLALLVLSVAASERPAATSYPAVTFDELIRQADMIFVGDVLDVRPLLVESREGTTIRTRVTFIVRDPLWGTASTLEILEFAGGEIGDRGERVAEMPTFRPGDRRLVFARRDRSINPIVGFTQGLLRLTRDPSGADVVETASGQALGGVGEIGRPRTLEARPARAMAFSSLRVQIVDRLRERRR